MKKLTLILISVLMILMLVACGDKNCEHIYDDCADTECNECGENRDSKHTWNNATCLAPKTCKVCGATEGAALGHEWTTPDVDLCEVQSTCLRCGATYGENKEHTPSEDDGDCTTEVKCTVCTDVTTPSAQHVPNSDDGDCTTPITCSVCGTVTAPANDTHTGGTATCTEKAVCTVCNTAYGTVDASNHIDENTDHICDRGCGKTDVGTHADANGDHKCEYGCSTTVGIHADSREDDDHVCDYGCGETLSDHEGGTATCVEYAVCTVCKNQYGDLAYNSHVSSDFIYVDNGDGTHDKHYACCKALCARNEDHVYVGSQCVCGLEAPYISGVALTVDGVTYDSANGDVNVYITPLSKISVTIYGANLQNAPEHGHPAVSGTIVWFGAGDGTVNEEGTESTFVSSPSEWIYESNSALSIVNVGGPVGGYEHDYYTGIFVVYISGEGTDLTNICFNNVNAWETVTATFYTAEDYYGYRHLLDTAELSLVDGESAIYSTDSIPKNATYVTFSNGTETTDKIEIPRVSDSLNCYNAGRWEHYHVAPSFLPTEDGKQHIAALPCCGLEVTENHEFDSENNCICGAKIEITGFTYISEETYTYDESTNTYTVIIPPDRYGANAIFQIIGNNFEYLKEDNTLLMVREKHYITGEIDFTFELFAEDKFEVGWSGMREGGWVEYQYSNDGGITWSDAVRVEIKT